MGGDGETEAERRAGEEGGVGVQLAAQSCQGGRAVRRGLRGDRHSEFSFSNLQIRRRLKGRVQQRPTLVRRPRVVLSQHPKQLRLHLIGRDLDMQTPIEFYFVFFPMMWVIGALPLSIAGIGILEGGLVLLFVRFTGAQQEAATALAFCQRLIIHANAGARARH